MTSTLPKSYFSPRLEARPLPAKGFFGVFAREPIPAGELLVMWSGWLLDSANLHSIDPLVRSRSVQVEEDLFLIPLVTDPPEPADFINHSCNPNAGLSGQLALVALRHIAAGEEICYDYAMTDGSPYDEFQCFCLEPTCRHHVTGNDWQILELQQRYQDHFSPYLLRRIARLHTHLTGQSIKADHAAS
jgi:hypothetical protein